MKKSQKLSILFVLWACSSALHAQNMVATAIKNYPVPTLRTEEFLDVKFDWNMKGNVQVQLNEGINFLKEGKYLQSVGALDSALSLDRGLWMAFYYRAIARRITGEIKSADKDLQKANKMKPGLAEIHLELGKLNLFYRQPEKAVAEFKLAYRLNPGQVLGMYYQGIVELVFQHWDEAGALFRKCYAVDSKFAQGYFMEAMVNVWSGRFKNETVLFDKAIAADPMFADAYFWRGMIWYDLTQTDKAVADFDQAVRLSPGNLAYLFFRGKIRFKKNDFDGAFTDLRKVILANPADEDLYTNGKDFFSAFLGFQSGGQYLIRVGYGLDGEAFNFLKQAFCLMVNDEPNKAILFTRHAERRQKSAAVYFLRGLNFEKERKHDSAFSNYDRALKYDNDIFEAHKKRGFYFSVLKDYKKATSDLDDMKRLQPASKSVLRLSADIKYHLGDLAGSVRDLTQFIERDSTEGQAVRAEVFKTRAMVRIRTGDHAGSNADYERAGAIAKQEPFVIVDMGLNNLYLGDTVKALSQFRAYATMIGFLEFRQAIYLGKCYTACKEFGDARSMIRLAHQRLFPTEKTGERVDALEANTAFLEGEILFYKNKYEKAIEKLSEALKNDPELIEARYHRGIALQRIGQHEKASADFKVLKDYRNSEILLKTVTTEH